MRSEREIFILYYEMMYRFVFFLVKEKDLTEDIVQETFIKAFKHLHTLQDETKIETWLKTIARRTAYDYLRKQKKWNENTVEEVYLEKDIEQSVDIEGDFADSEVKQSILKGLSELKPIQRDILILKLLEEKTDEEIAKELTIKVGTVKSRIHRAKELLKKKLRGGGDGEDE